MNRDRLGRLASLLEAYKPNNDGPRFDLGSWGEFEERRSGFLWLKRHPCDTAACAVGLACLSGIFRAEGLRFVRDENEIAPIFSGQREWPATEKFFDLTKKQARRLFAQDSYRISYGETAAKAVAARIRRMIAPRMRKAKKPTTDISILTALLDSKPPLETVEGQS